MDLHLAGKTVLVTGASQGIGAAIAESCAAEGCSLLLVARSAEKLAAVAKHLVDVYQAAVSTLSIDIAARGAAARILKWSGAVDVLVNNAGDIPRGDLQSVDEDLWRAAWELKVFGYINLARCFYSAMKQRGTGVILNNIGVGGEMPDFNYVAGCTANAALMAFTESVGARSLDDGIRVVGVNPGPVHTPRVERLLRHRAARELGDETRYVEFLHGFPRGRAARVEEIADLFVYLASERSSYTSGSVFTVDGGLRHRR